jgi:hypothetical protein
MVSTFFYFFLQGAVLLLDLGNALISVARPVMSLMERWQ